MTIKAKLLWTLLGMSALVALVGGIAVNRQHAAGVLTVRKEAENTARVIGLAYATDTDPIHGDSERFIQRLSHTLGRDVEVIGLDKRILADAVPKHVGMVVDDTEGAIEASLRDGRVRAFIEKSADYQNGIRQIVVPAKSDSGRVECAVIIEYTPLYNEMMEITRTARWQVAYVAAGAILITLALSLYLGHCIATPLRQLTDAATSFWRGETNLPMPPSTGDEIGELAKAFKIMIEKRQETEKALRHARDEMEARVIERTGELAAANAQLQREVAERRQAEEAAHHGEERVGELADDLALERGRLKNILNTIPAVVFENWLHGGKARMFVSDYVETMFGFTVKEWCSSPLFWSERVHPDDRERLLANAADLFSAKGGSSKQRSRWVTKDNRVIWGETYLKVARDPADGTMGICGFTIDITEQKRAEQELELLHEEVITASRQAGMAEVATNVLHNVGNVLNSVNISAGIVYDHVRQSSVPHLGRATALLQANAANLGSYLESDPIGQKLPGFLSQLAAQLDVEQTAMLRELEQLGKNVEHIKDIVAVQQNYATAAGMSQTVEVTELVEDSLRMNAGALMRHDVQLTRDFEISPTIQVDKHKVIQILINLIRNAKYACDESGRTDKRLTVRITGDDQFVRVSVIDNGIGIPAENMTRIFSHGFTTRSTGHGFGLHSGALAANELGGALLADSGGPGCGATFTLQLPLKSSKANS